MASTPGPPAFVTIARFGPVGRGCFAKIDEQLKRSPIFLTLTIPALLNAVSYIISSPAMAPVCEAAAFAPSLNLPDLITIIGFALAKLRAALINFLASVMASTYSTMLLV